jgi:hypothetical protein
VEITLRKLRRDKVAPSFLPASLALGSILASVGNRRSRRSQKKRDLGLPNFQSKN